MTTALRTNHIQDEYERPVPGASVYVYNLDGSLASLTSDGTTALANPMSTDAFGNYSYYAAIGLYREDVWFGGKLRWSENNVNVGNVVPLANVDLAGNGVGLFINASNLSLPSGIDVAVTTGYSALDVGAAIYVYDAAVNGTYVAANPRTSFVELGGRGFRLSLNQSLNQAMFGSDAGAAAAALAFISANSAAVASGGDSYAIAPNGAPTVFSRHIIRNYLEDIPGVVVGNGGNAATNASAINVALASGVYYHMRPGALYRIGSSLILPSNSGLIFEGDHNKPVILMPAANFTNADNSSGSRYGTNAVGINLSGQKTGPYTPVSGVVLENFILQSETNIGRYLRGIVGQNISKCRFYGLEVFGIPTGIGLCLASAQNCEIERPYVHDFTDSTNWASLPQSTGIEIDNDIVNAVTSLNVSVVNFRIENLRFTGSALSTWGYQTDGINIANAGARVRVADGRISLVGEGIDNFSCDGTFSDITMESIDQYGWKGIHGASRNEVSNLSVRNVGIAGVLFAGSSIVAQDTESNLVKNLSVWTVDPNGTWAGSDTAGVLIIDNGGTTGKPRNNQVDGFTVFPGTNGKYGWLDSSAGARNMGHKGDVRDGAGLLKRIYVSNGAGAAQIKSSSAYHINLDPSTIPVPRNISRPSSFPYTPSPFEEVILVQGSGARTINLPPEWSGVIKDGALNANTGTITVQGVAQATGTGAIAIVNGQGVLTMSAVTGTIYEGMGVTGTGVTAGTVVDEWLSGTRGGIGTYRVNKPQTVASEALTFPAAGNIDGAATQTITAAGGKLRVDPSGGAGNGWAVTA